MSPTDVCSTEVEANLLTTKSVTWRHVFSNTSCFFRSTGLLYLLSAVVGSLLPNCSTTFSLTRSSVRCIRPGTKLSPPLCLRSSRMFSCRSWAFSFSLSYSSIMIRFNKIFCAHRFVQSLPSDAEHPKYITHTTSMSVFKSAFSIKRSDLSLYLLLKGCTFRGMGIIPPVSSEPLYLWNVPVQIFERSTTFSVCCCINSKWS